MAFPWPETLSGLLPLIVAVVTVLFGLVTLFAPRLTLKALALAPAPKRPGDFSGARDSLAGFWLGVGIVAVAFYDQPFVQMSLGAGWLFSAFGRLVSNLSDETAMLGWLVFVIELLLAGAVLAPVFGFI